MLQKYEKRASQKLLSKEKSPFHKGMGIYLDDI